MKLAALHSDESLCPRLPIWRLVDEVVTQNFLNARCVRNAADTPW